MHIFGWLAVSKKTPPPRRVIIRPLPNSLGGGAALPGRDQGRPLHGHVARGGPVEHAALEPQTSGRIVFCKIFKISQNSISKTFASLGENLPNFA